jgi:A/G-specific adenine glycosylase
MQVPTSNKTIEGALYASQWLEEHPEMPSQLRHILVQYYQDRGRKFPWRETSDPYKIFVAELLLQKTAVKPVEQIWTSFLRCYPDIETLAAASIQEIEAIVSPLGLRKRAEVLHNAAQCIMRETGGKIIGDARFLRSLPGIGEYITSAVLSFAFDIKAVTIDVNSARVYSRISGFSPNTLRQGLALASKVGECIATQQTHRSVNLGLLDLAAQICRPKPLCGICPALNICCYARKGVTGKK